jgi:hypothetical protein
LLIGHALSQQDILLEEDRKSNSKVVFLTRFGRLYNQFGVGLEAIFNCFQEPVVESENNLAGTWVGRVDLCQLFSDLVHELTDVYQIGFLQVCLNNHIDGCNQSISLLNLWKVMFELNLQNIQARKEPQLCLDLMSLLIIQVMDRLQQCLKFGEPLVDVVTYVDTEELVDVLYLGVLTWRELAQEVDQILVKALHLGFVLDGLGESRSQLVVCNVHCLFS